MQLDSATQIAKYLQLYLVYKFRTFYLFLCQYKSDSSCKAFITKNAELSLIRLGPLKNTVYNRVGDIFRSASLALYMAKKPMNNIYLG